MNIQYNLENSNSRPIQSMIFYHFFMYFLLICLIVVRFVVVCHDFVHNLIIYYESGIRLCIKCKR